MREGWMEDIEGWGRGGDKGEDGGGEEGRDRGTG